MNRALSWLVRRLPNRSSRRHSCVLSAGSPWSGPDGRTSNWQAKNSTRSRRAAARKYTYKLLISQNFSNYCGPPAAGECEERLSVNERRSIYAGAKRLSSVEVPARCRTRAPEGHPCLTALRRPWLWADRRRLALTFLSRQPATTLGRPPIPRSGTCRRGRERRRERAGHGRPASGRRFERSQGWRSEIKRAAPFGGSSCG
jgi:hypothetical protein